MLEHYPPTLMIDLRRTARTAAVGFRTAPAHAGECRFPRRRWLVRLEGLARGAVAGWRACRWARRPTYLEASAGPGRVRRYGDPGTTPPRRPCVALPPADRAAIVARAEAIALPPGVTIADD